MMLLDLLLTLLAVPVLVVTSYLALLALLARQRSPLPLATKAPATLRFAVVVPAHNEAAGIAHTVRSLCAVDYPRELFEVVVVADNCSDDTATLAAQAGATVLARTSATERGKGYALAFAFEHVLSSGHADAVVVIDADTVVSPNLLVAFASRFLAGAEAVQAEYGVANSQASWRTRLMKIAFALFHVVRSSARERLLLSCGLRGNGMGFSRAVLARVPHRAFSIVEDMEYGFQLGLAGVRVWYVAEAEVRGEMVASEQASRSQRRRWEGGRIAMAKLYVPTLLARALGRQGKDPAVSRAVLLDLAMDLIVPPLSYIVLASGFGFAAAVTTALVLGQAMISPWVWAATVGMIAFYVCRGWMLSRVGLRGLLDLAWAPVYVAWKLLLLLKRPQHKPGEWVRTTREGEGR